MSGGRGISRGDAGGRVVVRLDSSPSTNDEVRARFEADRSGRGFPHLSTVVTMDQTAGRGRLGRAWVTPPGSCLAMSTILRLSDAARPCIGWLALAGGLALREAVLEQPGWTDDAASRLTVKWPNDVLIDGRKTAGILGEVLELRADGIVCVLGTGVNVRLSAEQLPVETATSLEIAGVVDPDPERLQRRYLAALTSRVDELERHAWDADAAGVRAELLAVCSTLGQRVRVALPGDAVLVGLAIDVGPSGALLVRDDAGRVHEVGAGDVERVRPV